MDFRRWITAFILIGVLLPILLFFPSYSYILLTILFLGIWGEWQRVFFPKKRFKLKLYLAIIVLGDLIYQLLSHTSNTILTSISSAGFLTIGLFLLLWSINYTRKLLSIKDRFIYFSGIYLILGCLFSVHTLIYFGYELLLLQLGILIGLTDSISYVFGKFVLRKNKHLLWVAISPKKTWTGFLAPHIIWTVIVGVVSMYLFVIAGTQFIRGFELPINPIDSRLVGALLYVVPTVYTLIFMSQMGDLFASWAKRSMRVKDFGNILPGHGGLLDRFDSYLFTLPFIGVVVFIYEILIRNTIYHL
ncbi:MAG: phosphatidate cytidylyltransferase [Alphaproteobacteria bacterium]|nr:phosphatidate cytidylyltransferase [Alphaproteobacteria bacterium]MBL0717900.1 phosphatidate cytidylyltransferase [Alphaproteobacteria bacterium]